ncbi:MAG: bacillithiol biosynthesis BshC [Planctomycetota bacterium]
MAFEVRHLPGDVLGLDAFARAVLAGRPRPRVFGGLVPARVEEFEQPERADDPALLDRDDLAERLTEHVRPDALHPAVAESIDKLADARGLAVVASVRPAFLGGPLAHLHATLHAAALARELERAWRRPVAPVLWVRSDEHALEEVRSVRLLTRHLDLARTGLASMGSGRRPIGSIVLGDESHRLPALRGQLAQVLLASEHRDRAIALFMPRAGETLGDATRRAFGALLGHLGVVCVEPKALRGTLSRALARIVERGGADLLEAARERLGDLARVDEHALLFRHVDGARAALRLDGAQFLFDGEEAQRSGAELAAEIVADPEGFSAGAILEPIARDLVLPVAATVGGWNVARDVAAGAEWRRSAGAPPARFVPRQHATLVSPMVREALRKRDVDLESVLRARGVVEDAPVAADRPEVLDRLRETIARHANELRDLRSELSEIDKGLAHHLRRAAEENADRARKILERAERVHGNRAGKSRKHARRLANTLFPDGAPQEAVSTTLQYACAFGTDWIDALADAIDPFPSEHLVLEL